jgi:hypothetical protein
MADWPATLPQNFLANTSVKDDESRLTTSMDSGPASVRNRFTAISQVAKGPLVLTGAQLVIFDAFFRTTLQQGALSFTWKHPKTDATADMRFKGKPEWKCVKPASSPNDRLWMADFEIEILP